MNLSLFLPTVCYKSAIICV